MFVLILS